MGLDSQLRKMSMSDYWQGIYNASKECHGIQLFENTYNFSGIQKLFMYYLKMYNMVYTELYQLEYENLSLEVIEDNDRLDAFLYWRNKQQEKKLREYNKENKKSSKGSGNSFKVFTGATNNEESEKE